MELFHFPSKCQWTSHDSESIHYLIDTYIYQQYSYSILGIFSTNARYTFVSTVYLQHCWHAGRLQYTSDWANSIVDILRIYADRFKPIVSLKFISWYWRRNCQTNGRNNHLEVEKGVEMRRERKKNRDGQRERVRSYSDNLPFCIIPRSSVVLLIWKYRLTLPLLFLFIYFVIFKSLFFSSSGKLYIKLENSILILCYAKVHRYYLLSIIYYYLLDNITTRLHSECNLISIIQFFPAA